MRLEPDGSLDGLNHWKEQDASKPLLLRTPEQIREELIKYLLEPTPRLHARKRRRKWTPSSRYNCLRSLAADDCERLQLHVSAEERLWHYSFGRGGEFGRAYGKQKIDAILSLRKTARRRGKPRPVMP